LAATPEGITPGVDLQTLRETYPDGEFRPDEPCLGTVFIAPWTEWQGSDYYIFGFGSDPDRVAYISAGFGGWC
jgi:hypothetical protein